MHGRKRAEYKAQQRDPKVAAHLSKKAQQWHAIHAQLTEKPSLPLLDTLLQVHPDPYTLWNMRRDLLLQQQIDWPHELRITATALQNHPKAYGAWHHRLWVVQQTTADPQTASEELSLIQQFLRLDERNFHCWKYRKLIVQQLLLNETNDTVLQQEWDFCHAMLQTNFSNYSAWHARAQLLDWKLSHDNILQDELVLVEAAIFTEPHDQSVWWYHHALVQRAGIALEAHVQNLQELAQEVPDCKWVWLGLFAVQTALQQADPAILQRLMELDPDRAARYRYLLEQ